LANKKVDPGKRGEEKVRAPDSELQLVLFTVSGDKYAIDIMKAKEIIKPVKVTPLPNVPDFIKGVINLRGMLLPVISMKERFGIADEETEEISSDARVIIVAMQKMAFGVMVDSVEEIIRVPFKDLQPPPRIGRGIDSDYLLGICRMDDEALVLLDLDKILTSTEKVMMEELRKKKPSAVKDKKDPK